MQYHLHVLLKELDKWARSSAESHARDLLPLEVTKSARASRELLDRSFKNVYAFARWLQGVAEVRSSGCAGQWLQRSVKIGPKRSRQVQAAAFSSPMARGKRM